MLLEIPYDALRRVEAVRAPPREDHRIDLVNHVERIEEIGFARPGRAAALCDAAHRAVPVDEDHRASSGAFGQRVMTDLDALHLGQSLGWSLREAGRDEEEQRDRERGESLRHLCHNRLQASGFRLRA